MPEPIAFGFTTAHSFFGQGAEARVKPDAPRKLAFLAVLSGAIALERAQAGVR